MDMTYWHKQTDKPLFPNLLWSRPGNRQQAGKLLIIGGNLYGFAAAAEAYAGAERAGIGVGRVLLPDALQKLVGRSLEAGEFAPSNPSGSFSQKALVDFMAHTAWADGILLAGDLGRNSETAILIEKFITAYSGQLTLTKDAVDYVSNLAQTVLARPQTTLVLSFAQLQKLAMGVKFSPPFTFSMGILRFIENLHAFTSVHPVSIIVKHLDIIFVAANGTVSSTKLAIPLPIWRVTTAAYASVWWLQNPTQTYEALTSAVYDVANNTIPTDGR